MYCTENPLKQLTPNEHRTNTERSTDKHQTNLTENFSVKIELKTSIIIR